MKDTLDGVLTWINNNRGKFIGGVIGFITSILIISIGLFKTLFIIMCTIVGYVLGSYNISVEDIKRTILNFFQ